jgi:hypothetical protein
MHTSYTIKMAKFSETRALGFTPLQMQCPEQSNAYIKTYARKRVQASTKEEGNFTNH